MEAGVALGHYERGVDDDGQVWYRLTDLGANLTLEQGTRAIAKYLGIEVEDG